MKTIKIAWRNLWRNKKRSIITISSIAFSVYFAIWMRSLQEGSYDNMIENVVKFYSGYMQIQDTAYWEERTLDNSFFIHETTKNKIENINDIDLISSRIESFGLAANQDKSKPVFIIGICPEKEDKILKLSSKIVEGNFISSGGNGVVISEGLARFLDLGVLDTLVLISQGYHSASAAGKYQIESIVKHPSPEFNNRTVFMDIKMAQSLFSLENRQTAMIIMVNDYYGIEKVQNKIQSLLPEDKKVLRWDEMQPELLGVIKTDRESGYLILIILYMVIAFGIFGTAIMMINERKREIGVLNALGMRKSSINLMMFCETIMLGIVGAIAGIILSFPLILFLNKNPRPLKGEIAEMMLEYGMEPYLFTSLVPKIFISQATIVFIVCIIVGLLGNIIVSRMKMIKALRA